MKKQNLKGNAGNDLPDYGEKWMEELLKQGKHEIAKFYRLQILCSNRLQEQNRELLEALKNLQNAAGRMIDFLNDDGYNPEKFGPLVEGQAAVDSADFILSKYSK